MLLSEDATVKDNLMEKVTFYADGFFQKATSIPLLRFIEENSDACREIIVASTTGNPICNAFVRAGKENDVRVLDVLLDHGMDINAINLLHQTALMCACSKGHKEATKILLNRNACVDFQDDRGITAMMCACVEGNTRMVEYLLEKNPNLDLQDSEGYTALMRASEWGYEEEVRLLLTQTLNVDLKNNQGYNAAFLAERNRIQQLIDNYVPPSYILK